LFACLRTSVLTDSLWISLFALFGRTWRRKGELRPLDIRRDGAISA
jgi:hypothetical protein